MVYRFAGFELDEEARQLRGGSGPVRLQPLIFDLLAILVRNHARVVPKDELFAVLWPDVSVTEASLQRAISLVRSALNDASHDLIRTFVGYGYRFCGDVTAIGRTLDGAPPIRRDSALPPPGVQYARTADGVSIAFWTLGHGPPLLYVPNLIWSHGQLEWKFPEIQRWYRQLAAGRTLVRFDPRGTGSSQREVEHYSLPAIQLDVEAVVKQLGLETFSLFGDLNGGPVVLRYAAEHPDRVRSIVLWHTFASPNEIDGPKLRMLESLQPLMDRDWETYTETRAHMGFGWSDGAGAHRYATLLRECVTPEVARRSYDAGRVNDVTPLLPRIGAPALVLHRRHFYFWDVTVSRTLATRIRNSRLVVLDGAVSAPFLGDSDGVVAAIDDFTAEQQAG